MDFEAVRSDSVIIHAFPFNSEKKRGGVAVKLVISDICLVMLLMFSSTSYLRCLEECRLCDSPLSINTFRFGSLILKFVYTGKGLQK